MYSRDGGESVVPEVEGIKVRKRCFPPLAAGQGRCSLGKVAPTFGEWILRPASFTYNCVLKKTTGEDDPR